MLIFYWKIEIFCAKFIPCANNGKRWKSSTDNDNNTNNAQKSKQENNIVFHKEKSETDSFHKGGGKSPYEPEAGAKATEKKGTKKESQEVEDDIFARISDNTRKPINDKKMESKKYDEIQSSNQDERASIAMISDDGEINRIPVNPDEEKFYKEFLEWHNNFRRLHNVPSLNLNQKLMEFAKDRAKVCTDNNDMSAFFGLHLL